MAAAQVHDAQAAMGEGGVAVDVEAGPIRTAMVEHVVHPGCTGALVGMQPVGGDNASDATHGSGCLQDCVFQRLRRRVVIDVFPEPEFEHQE
jgi:hypothetical protein